MGSSGSTLQPALVRREQLRCDSKGVATFRTCTLNGQPGRPGLYKIICNVNINQVHVYGVRPDDSVTRSEFVGKMPSGNTRIFRYVPMQANTPYLKGFKGEFTAIPNKDVAFELWWIPLDY